MATYDPADQGRHMSMQSHTIPSGRPASGSSLAGMSVIAVSAVLGLLALIGLDPSIVALIAIVVLGSIVILTDESLENKSPHAPLV
jgi:hypothetical protein